MHTIPVISQASTVSVSAAERIAYWEDYNRRHVVGLTCSTYAEEGLRAGSVSLGIGDVRLTDIAGNGHVIERTPAMCRSAPKDSVFASLLLRGEAFFYHGDGCLTLRAGDIVLYDTRRPYIFGFPQPMRQLLVDIPREAYTQWCGTPPAPVPALLDTDRAGRATLRSTLTSVLVELAATRTAGGGDSAAARGTVLELLHALVHARAGIGRPPGPDARLSAAKAHIDRYLDDPGLSVERVADAAGISVRHLTRVFEGQGTVPSRYIRDQRLARAREQLGDPGSAAMTIADVAHRWGFASHAHFARVFRARYGQTPREVRTQRG